MKDRVFEIDPWKIKTTVLEHENIRLQESLTAIGNGYMGMRGNFEEGYSGNTLQGTYLAGVWYPDKTRVGWWKNGYPDYYGKVINAPSIMEIKISIDGIPVDLKVSSFDDYYEELNMKNGLLTRSFTVTQQEKKINVRFERFVSITTKELAMFKISVTMLEGAADIQLTPSIDGYVKNEDSNYDEMFWLKQHSQLDEFSSLTMKTKPNDFAIEEFTVTAMMKNVVSNNEKGILAEGEMKVTERYNFHLKKKEAITLTKYVSVVTSRDVPPEEQKKRCKEILMSTVEKGWEEELRLHSAEWGKRWQKADVIIEGNDEAQQGIRYNIFQLFSTYYGEDERLNIGPKGFTGEKYGGATYWDTEAYIIPMYLSVADSSVTKKLLDYRHNHLPEAFHNARKQGLKGALYPMVTFNGIECHNEWEITFGEIHRNGAIAHAIYNYVSYTGDEAYLIEKGIDVLVGISRFWADRVHYSKRTNQYMIHGVTGPNEYENNVNNNWYTNYCAVWVLSYTLTTLKKITPEKSASLSVTKEEKNKWEDIIQNMYFPVDEKLGIFIQHDTFLDKDLQPVSHLTKKDLPLNQNWSWDKILRSPFIKQADVLQGIYFFNDQFTLSEKKRNFEFYEPMTVHESSLSPSIHSVLASELGKKDKAMELYHRTARLDLDNYNRDTEDGLHITSMSGSWLAIAHGFGGMRTYSNRLAFRPYLPKEWSRYQFTINYRKREIKLEVAEKTVTLFLLSGSPLTIWLYDQEVYLENTYETNVEY